MSGDHEFILKNVKGQNAIDYFSLISEESYNSYKNEVEEKLKNKTIICHFKGQDDFYTINKLDKDTQNDKEYSLILSPDGKAWNTINIIKSGLYKLTFYGKGNFSIKFANETYATYDDGSSEQTFGPFMLKQGSSNITIIPNYSNSFNYYK